MAMMKGAMGCPVANIMEETFSCTVANRFYQLLDDESDPLDNLCEAERRQQQRKNLNKLVARRGSPGGRGGTAKREPQKQRKQLGTPAPPPQLGTGRRAAGEWWRLSGVGAGSGGSASGGGSGSDAIQAECCGHRECGEIRGSFRGARGGRTAPM